MKTEFASSSTAPTTCRAFWVEGRGRGALVEAPLPSRKPGEVLVRTLYSAISRGTEALVFAGAVPENVAGQMRAPFQEGEFPWPVKYGYSSVGRVLEGPESLLDKHVFCLFPHQDFYVVPASDAVPLPEGLLPARAVLAANMETALNALWDAELKAGDKVSVVGAGVVGSLVAFLAGQYPGTEVELIDTNDERKATAQGLGVTFCRPEEAKDSRDVVFHASGRAEGLRTALALAGPEATVVELSWYGSTEVTLPLGGRFHPARLRLQSSQVGSLPSHQKARWTHRRRLEKALELCASEALDVLLTSESKFSDLPRVMELLSTQGELCRRICYP